VVWAPQVVRGRITWLATDEPATKSSLNCQKCYVPAVGINAAVNSRDFGTFRWQLNEKSKATPVCRALEGFAQLRHATEDWLTWV
jgi:hypothetical protein